MTEARRKPVQRRSRDRVDQIVAATAELLHEGSVDAVTTRSVAKRSGVPVGTVYRYFSNRDEIIAAFLDRELEKIDEVVAAGIRDLKLVTLRTLIETIAIGHMRHHQANRAIAVVWFGGRRSLAVLDRVKQMDASIAGWLRSTYEATGLLRDDAPEFGNLMMVRLFDRMFEFVFTENRSADEEERIVMTFTDMVATYSERYATRDGLEGITIEEFTRRCAKHGA